MYLDKKLRNRVKVVHPNIIVRKMYGGAKDGEMIEQCKGKSQQKPSVEYSFDFKKATLKKCTDR